jgi:hypothetical protein
VFSLAQVPWLAVQEATPAAMSASPIVGEWLSVGPPPPGASNFAANEIFTPDLTSSFEGGVLDPVGIASSGGDVALRRRRPDQASVSSS